MVDVARITMRLPEGFVLERHKTALEAQVAKSRGTGWKLKNVSRDGKSATFEREVSVTQVEVAEEMVTLQLNSDEAKVSAGDSVAANYEDRYVGFYLTDFQPHLKRAEMTKLTAGAVRTRKALSVALGCKPWEVKIKTNADGGYTLGLPQTYMPSKHDAKIEEVTETVAGNVGWRVEINPKSLAAKIIPGEPPLFPEMVPYPMHELGPDGELDSTLIGVSLPPEGVGIGRRVYIDWTSQSFALCGGTPGSGKTVMINSVLSQQRSSGAELVIVDDKSKAVDFDWCKGYVRPGGWGCDSEKQAVAALAMVYEEGNRRSGVLREMKINNWLDMPPGKRFKPIFVVVDELSALLVLDPVPRGLSKDNALVVEVNELNYMRQLIARYINKIIAEQRFVGVRMLLSTQITNANTGLPPSTKGKIGHRILQGSNPSAPQRDQMFNDAKGVPTVPPHVQASGKNARGVGVADLEGEAPILYKSLFASVGDYLKRFEELGIATTSNPEPTATQIAKYVPSLEDEEPVRRADTPSGKPLDPAYGPVETFDSDGNMLFGAAAAASASKKLTSDGPAKKAGPPCPACGLLINDGCEC